LNSPDEPFIYLFECLFINFNVKQSNSIIDKCADIIDKNYFMTSYKQTFIHKCREIIFENHISLNTSINLNSFSTLFQGNIEETRTFINEFINMNLPGENVHEKDGILHYDIRIFEDDKYVNKILICNFF